MLRSFGRTLKLLGLVIAPLALLLQMTGVLRYGWQELVMLLCAVIIFIIGHTLDTHTGTN